MSITTVDNTELFDEFIEDDFFSNAFNQIDLHVADLSVPSFNCLGEVSVKEIRVNPSGYFHSKFGPESVLSKKSFSKCKPESIYLFEKSWDKGVCLFNHLDRLFQMASLELMILDEASIIPHGSIVPAPDLSEDMKRDFYLSRKHCIELYLFINDFLLRLLDQPDYNWALEIIVDKVTKRLDSIRKQLGTITQLPDHIYLFCAHSQGNKSEKASYHSIHCRFDMLWLNVHLEATLSRAVSCSPQPPSLQHHILSSFREMFDLVLVRFNKIDHRDLSIKSAFSCTCVQELWIMLQIVSDTDLNNDSGKGFWSYFDCFILAFLKLRSSGYDDAEISPFKLDSSHFLPTTSYLFSIWFTYNVGKLYTFNSRTMISNYPLLENILKNLISQDVSELEMRTCLHFIEKLCLELWHPKTELLLILWEYFQKRLDQLFYVSGQDLDSITTLGKSALSLLSQVKGRLEDPHIVRNSYEHFLRIIGLHLKRCKEVNQTQRHWNLLTGRIYSKLTPPKLLSLNQTGEYHFVSLFLTLAVTADLNQVMTKFGGLCSAYLQSKGGFDAELLKGLLAMCLLLIERGQPITNVLPPLIQFLSTADTDENIELFSITIDALLDILDHHHSLTLGQHLFIDSWITRYLSCGAHKDSTKLLEVLLTLIVKVKRQIDVDPNTEMEELVERLWSNLSDYLIASSSSSYIILADIAANLASIFLTLSNTARFSSIISLFSNNQSSDVRLVQRFIVQLVQNDRIKEVLTDMDQLIIETWIKSNIVCSELDHNEMKTLGSIIASLPEIKYLCGPAASIAMFTSDEPLLEFFSAIHSKYQITTVESERSALSTKVCTYLRDLDRWLKPLLTSCSSAQQISKLYFGIGTAFSFISPLLYVKSKPNNLLQSTVSLMLLPISVHNSEAKIHPFILTSIRKTLHLFLTGLNNLEPHKDPYIGRCVKEIILVYIPRCLANTGPLPSQHHISSFSLISLFNEFEPSLSRLILENISLSFFRPKARTPLPKSVLAVRFIKELLLLHCSSEKVLLAVINHSMESVCDIIMFCDNKTSVYMMCKDILRLFFENDLLKRSQSLKVEVLELLSCICGSCLAFSSRHLFDLLYLLCTFIPSIMKQFLPKLLQHICLIETKRGVTSDKILRLGYDRIKAKLLT